MGGAVTHYTLRLVWHEMLRSNADVALIVLGVVLFAAAPSCWRDRSCGGRGALLVAVPLAAVAGLAVFGVLALVCARGVRRHRERRERGLGNLFRTCRSMAGSATAAGASSAALPRAGALFGVGLAGGSELGEAQAQQAEGCTSGCGQASNPASPGSALAGSCVLTARVREPPAAGPASGSGYVRALSCESSAAAT